jgi:lysophospholipase L1-like esterase
MANGIMLTELVTLFGSDAMGITTIGTLGAGGAFHEAISGKTAAYYATDITNVFFNGGASLDVAGYMATNGFSMAADDWVIINLGINDMFSQTSNAGAAAKAALVVADYTTLINAFKAYEPGLRFSLGLVIPPAGDQSAFGDDYDSNQTRQRYRENSLTLSREIITTFGGREGEDIYITPITAGLDPLWSFDYVTENASSRSTEQVKRWTSGVHPNSDGYGQIADQIHAFLKFHQ